MATGFFKLHGLTTDSVTWDRVAETHRRDMSRRRPSENTLCGMRLPQKRTAHVDVLRCAMVPKLANKPRCGACEERLEAMRALEALS